MNKLPRIVLVTRRTPLELLLERFGTRGQAEFYLRSRGQSLAWADAVHEAQQAAMAQVTAAIDVQQARVRLDRDDLDRFLFVADDLVLVVGQDGLVPNVAKYLRGQTVIGINPDPTCYDGVLCQHAAGATAALLHFATARNTAGATYRIQTRSMALAQREDGQQLRALNEVFIGHASHQSARYRLRCGAQAERHSSSGLIAATGTGATGWARSITEQRELAVPLPSPEHSQLAWFVREPFPSVATGTALNFGLLEAGEELQLVSEMDEAGVIFADGIEADRVEFLSGQVCTIGLAPERLHLVVAATE